MYSAPIQQGALQGTLLSNTCHDKMSIGGMVPHQSHSYHMEQRWHQLNNQPAQYTREAGQMNTAPS